MCWIVKPLLTSILIICMSVFIEVPLKFYAVNQVHQINIHKAVPTSPCSSLSKPNAFHYEMYNRLRLPLNTLNLPLKRFSLRWAFTPSIFLIASNRVSMAIALILAWLLSTAKVCDDGWWIDGIELQNKTKQKNSKEKTSDFYFLQRGCLVNQLLTHGTGFIGANRSGVTLATAFAFYFFHLLPSYLFLSSPNVLEVGFI